MQCQVKHALCDVATITIHVTMYTTRLSLNNGTIQVHNI